MAPRGDTGSRVMRCRKGVSSDQALITSLVPLMGHSNGLRVYIPSKRFNREQAHFRWTKILRNERISSEARMDMIHLGVV